MMTRNVKERMDIRKDENKMKKVLFATTNPAKVKKYKKALEEKGIELITIKDLDFKLDIDEYGKDAIYIKSFDDIVSHIKANAKSNDLVLTLGAGTVTKIGPEIIKP